MSEQFFESARRTINARMLFTCKMYVVLLRAAQPVTATA